MDKYIDFLQIGFQKCGTMFFEKNLYSSNPQIYCVQAARVLDLERLLLQEFIYPDSLEYEKEAFEQHFQSLAPSLFKERDAKVRGIMFEAFTFLYEKHFDRKMILDRIRESFPDVKIIMLIRNQETWYASIYSQYVRSGGILNLHDFMECALGNPTLISHYVDWYPMVEYLFKIFGKDRVLVCLFEELGDSPDALASKVFQFVGVPNVEIDKTKKNESLSKHMLFVRRIMNRCIPFDYGKSSYGFFRNLWNARPSFTEGFWHSFIYKYYKTNTDNLLCLCDKVFNNKTRVVLSPYHIEKIHKRYAQNNKKLSELLGLNLSSQGYPV